MVHILFVGIYDKGFMTWSWHQENWQFSIHRYWFRNNLVYAFIYEWMNKWIYIWALKLYIKIYIFHNKAVGRELWSNPSPERFSGQSNPTSQLPSTLVLSGSGILVHLLAGSSSWEKIMHGKCASPPIRRNPQLRHKCYSTSHSFRGSSDSTGLLGSQSRVGDTCAPVGRSRSPCSSDQHNIYTPWCSVYVLAAQGREKVRP